MKLHWPRLFRKKSAPALFPSMPVNWFQQGMNIPRRFDRVPTVEACISAYATAVAQLPMQHVRIDENGVRRLLDSTAITSVLQKPNAYQTPADFLLNLVNCVLHEGNAYVFGVWDGPRTPAEMHLLDPRGTSVHVAEGEIFYSANGLNMDLLELKGRQIIPSRFIGHLKLHTPRDPLVGVSPIQAAAASIATNSAILSGSAGFFQNMSRPSGVLSTELELDKAQMYQLRQAWNEQSKGLNSGGVPILGNGLKWEPMSISSQDAQLVEAWRMSVEDIARVFRVPPPLIGHLDDATYANVNGLMQFWLQTGLGFHVRHIEEMLTRFFRLPADQAVELDTSVLLRTDEKARLEALGVGVTKGVLSPNEARRREGLPPVEGGDMPRVQQQMIPLNADPAQYGAPPAEITDDTPKQFLEDLRNEFV